MRAVVIAFAMSICLASLHSAESSAAEQTTADPSAHGKPHVDRSGKKRVGKASVYAKHLAGKAMADGTPMEAHGDNAASKTLPLGTTAQVTNLETGKSAVVTIRDRGPYAKGRIIDLSPGTARQIGLAPAEGVAKVEVAPLSLPEAPAAAK